MGQLRLLLDGYSSLKKKNQTFKAFDFVYLQILAAIKDRRAVAINISDRTVYLLPRADGPPSSYQSGSFPKNNLLSDLLSAGKTQRASREGEYQELGREQSWDHRWVASCVHPFIQLIIVIVAVI